MSARGGIPTRAAATWRAPVSLLVLLTVLTVTACDRELPVEPPEEEVVPGEVVASLSCEGSVVGGLACMQEPEDVPEGMSAAIIGGQDTYVQLMQHSFTWDGVDKLTSEISVKNLMQQALGSDDGTTPHANGVRIFFHSAPTITSGHGGEVTVDNATGTGTFTGANQDYFLYDQMLVPGKRSLSETWEFTLPDPGATFSFQVYVTAAVPDEDTIEEALPGSTTKLVAQSITAGFNHSCGLNTAGKAYCWGLNDRGQLGNGDGLVASTSTPLEVNSAETWAAISAGLNHSCGITRSGTAYCWGADGVGQLGNDAAFSPDQYSPVPVSGGDTWSTISAGQHHTCGVTVDGTGYCWGEGADLRLGNGGTADAPLPAPVNDGHTWAAISAGWFHTCGVTTDGVGYCWGRGGEGRLGDGGMVSKGSPSPVADGHEWATISAGDIHSCGVTTEGVAYCWGHDNKGQLGNAGATTTSQSSPVEVASTGGTDTWWTIEATRLHSCGITTDGAGWCWGDGGAGRLGDGGTGQQTAPSPISATGTEPWAGIHGGRAHTCGVTTDGSGYCWGEAAAGKLGNGDAATDQTSPDGIAVVGPFARLDSDSAECTAAALLARTGCGFEMYALAPVREPEAVSGFRGAPGSG